VQLGRPFVGPSGKILDYACARGGISRGALAILNACACGPIPSAAESMKAAAIAACRPRLLAELRRLRPKVILAVGGYALRTLGAPNVGGVASIRGALLPQANDAPPAHFLATFHPAHIMRGGDGDQDQPGGDSGPAVDLLFYFFLYDLAKAARLASGEQQPWIDDVDLFAERGGRIVKPVFDDNDLPIDWEPVRYASDFAAAVDRIDHEACAAGELSCDVETDSKDAMQANLTAIALATPVGGLSATWAAWRLAKDARDVAADLLGDSSLPKVFHNRIYDTIVLPRHDLTVAGPVHDTLLKHHAAFPGLPHKLQQVATQFFASRPWKDEFRRAEKDEASLILYNARDTVATARLSPALDKLLRAHRVERVYEADRQQFAIATHMRRVGYWVDKDEQARQSKVQHARLDYMRTSLVDDFKAIEEPWRQALARILAQTQRKKDPDGYLDRVSIRYREIAERDRRETDIGIFKPKAHKDVTALFEVLRIPILDYTKKGAPKTDKKAMEAAAGRHPLMRKIIHLREATHLLATYIDGLPILSDARVHPDWSPKITGRWGAGKAQNWPKFVQGWPPEIGADGQFKRRPSGELVCPVENPRRIVAAPPGRILVGADFSQLELRIAGYLSLDEFLLDIFRRGVDPHAAFAREAFPGQFPQLEGDFAAHCQKIGRALKIKANLTNPSAPGYVVDLEAADRKLLAALAAKWSRLRDLTKRAEYCGIYGGTAETVYDSIVKDFPEVQLRDMQLLIASVNKQMSGVVRWRNEQENNARVNREIREQLLGRCRLFPLGNFNPNIVYNFPIQAFGASLMAFALFRFSALTHPELLQFDRLYELGLLSASWVAKMRLDGFDTWQESVDPLLNGHDSILAESAEADGARCARLLTAAMEQSLPMANGEMMAFPAEAAKGRRWSDT
jgi:uracil-DNA glycosylase family 4